MDNDIELLGRKNAEQKRLKMINAGLVVLVLILVSVLCFLVVVSRISDPTPDPKVEVIRNAKVVVPSTIEVGKEFTYTSTGEKLIEAIADIRVQLLCTTNAVQNIVPLTNFSSARPVGKYTATRSFAIPVSVRIHAADDCKLQFINTYTLYQTKNGQLNTIVLNIITNSNTFKLTVPDDYDQLVSLNPNSDASPLAPNIVSSSEQNPNVAKYSPTPVTEQPTPTKTSGQGSGIAPTNPITTVPEQPETRFIRRVIDNVLGVVGL